VSAWRWSTKNKKLKKSYVVKGAGGVATSMARVNESQMVAGFESGEITVWSATGFERKESFGLLF
jgi:hypothetical protein